MLLCRETAESVLAWDHDLPCHWRAGCPETGTAPTGCPRLQGNLAAPADLDAVAAALNTRPRKTLDHGVEWATPADAGQLSRGRSGHRRARAASPTVTTDRGYGT